MMKEVLGRRFSKTAEDLPDLVVVDGGKEASCHRRLRLWMSLRYKGWGWWDWPKARVESDFKATEVKSSFESNIYSQTARTWFLFFPIHAHTNY